MPAVADLSTAFPSFRLHELRQPLALNHFKKSVLGARHRPGNPQTREVAKVFSLAGMEWRLDPRTWRQWFNDPPRKARPDAVAKLDGHFDRTAELSPSAMMPPRVLGPTFYFDLIEGGLIDKLLRRTNAKPPIKTLLYRVYEYKPTSSLHLHLDALECAALQYEGGEVPCNELKAMAAKRILELIYERWRPGEGSIYKELSSSLELELISDGFQVRMKDAPSPDWMEIGVSEDFASSDIHKVLFMLAADTGFLRADRIDAWILDFASAGVAAYALAQTNSRAGDPFGLRPECRYWDAIRALFFGDGDKIDFDEYLERSFLLKGRNFMQDVEINLIVARERYREWLRDWGLSGQMISELALFQPLSPLIFVGGR